jgi:CBS domain-containing protein
MNVYDIDIVADSDEGRTVNVWTAKASNMAEALQDVMDKNKNMLNSKTEGAVMVTIIKQLSKQAEVANFEARAKVEQMSPEMVRLVTIESDVSLVELLKPPVKH